MRERLVLVSFAEVDSLLAAARELRRLGVEIRDAHTPFQVAELDEVLDLPASPVRPLMLVGAIVAAAGIVGLQYWNSAFAYPINSGGTSTAPWPAFGFATFELGVLGAALVGFVAMLRGCRLPTLHHGFFAARTTERASDDRFFLSLALDPRAEGPIDAAGLARLPGARDVLEIEAES